MDDGERALAEAERVLRQNWREGEADGVPYAYTEPSPGRYPWQWYWDSCFAAIVNRRFEPDRSRAELESLLAAQRPDGFIGHTIFWHRPVSGVRRAFYNVATRTARQTESIQPPLLAWAWRLAVGDPAAEPRIAAQADWLVANRDLDTGQRTKPGGYSLTDETYERLLKKITEQPERGIPLGLKQDIEAYYADPNAPIRTKKDPAAWARVQAELVVIESMKTRGLAMEADDALPVDAPVATLSTQ